MERKTIAIIITVIILVVLLALAILAFKPQIEAAIARAFESFESSLTEEEEGEIEVQFGEELYIDPTDSMETRIYKFFRYFDERYRHIEISQTSVDPYSASIHPRGYGDRCRLLYQCEPGDKCVDPSPVNPKCCDSAHSDYSDGKCKGDGSLLFDVFEFEVVGTPLVPYFIYPKIRDGFKDWNNRKPYNWYYYSTTDITYDNDCWDETSLNPKIDEAKDNKEAYIYYNCANGCDGILKIRVAWYQQGDDLYPVIAFCDESAV